MRRSGHLKRGAERNNPQRRASREPYRTDSETQRRVGLRRSSPRRKDREKSRQEWHEPAGHGTRKIRRGAEFCAPSTAAGCDPPGLRHGGHRLGLTARQAGEPGEHRDLARDESIRQAESLEKRLCDRLFRLC